MYKVVFKRFLDCVFAVILCPFVTIVVGVFGIWIVLDDGRPVFYMAERRGKNGKLFRMYKLRSMKNHSPDIRSEDGSTYNSADDPRLTKSGKIMRKFSIDELPQIYNVLLGDMSFIGPRPFIASMDYNELDEKRKKRLQVLPGITGYSQAYFRNSISQEEKIEKDCWYVDNVSFKTDLKILFKTVASVIQKNNIYNSN